MKNYIIFIFMVFLVLMTTWSCYDHFDKTPEIEKVVKMKIYNCSSDTITNIKINFERIGDKNFETVLISKMLIPKDSINFFYNADNDINDNAIRIFVDFKKLQSINSLFLDSDGTKTHYGGVNSNGKYMNYLFIQNYYISQCWQTLNNLGEVITDSTNCKPKFINQK